LFVPRNKNKEEQEQEDKEFSEFTRDRMAEKARDPSATLRTLLKDDDLDDDEKFLRSYVLGDQWKVEAEREKELANKPWYKDIVGPDVGAEEVVDDEEDEEEVKKAEDFEQSFNFRYEHANADKIVGHARKVEGSIRKEDERRKDKRKKKLEREVSVLEQKKQELARLKNVKKREIMERLKAISLISGAPNIDSSKVCVCVCVCAGGWLGGARGGVL
jgi:protein KRI1